MEIQWAFGLAAFAGFIRYIQKFTGPKADRPPWEWIGVCIAVLTGGFVGALTLWLLADFTLLGKKIEGGPLSFAVAIAGYGGPLSLDFFLDLGKTILKRAAEKASDDGPKN